MLSTSTNMVRFRERFKHRDCTELASGMLETEEQRIAYLYRGEYDCRGNGDRLLDGKLLCNESYTTLRGFRHLSRNRSPIAPSPASATMLLMASPFSRFGVIPFGGRSVSCGPHTTQRPIPTPLHPLPIYSDENRLDPGPRPISPTPTRLPLPACSTSDHNRMLR